MEVIGNKVKLDNAEIEVIEIALGVIPSFNVDKFKSWANTQLKAYDNNEESPNFLMARLSAGMLADIIPSIHKPTRSDEAPAVTIH